MKYKTISYPSGESGTGKVERIRLAISESESSDFIGWLRNLDSNHARTILESNYLKINEDAKRERRKLSNYTLHKLNDHYIKETKVPYGKAHVQLDLFSSQKKNLGVHGTFFPNHNESIHRWYPYLEGFSADFVESFFNEYATKESLVFDPFAGTGTTVTVASICGIKSFYTEINPFMRLIIECKTNILRSVASIKEEMKSYFSEVLSYASKKLPNLDDALDEQKAVFGKSIFFSGNRLREIISIKRAIEKCSYSDDNFHNFAKLILGSIAVASSNMKRAADLRKRTPKEMLPDDFSVLQLFCEKADQIIQDINVSHSKLTDVCCIGESTLKPYRYDGHVDLVFTSPPYLNGTNYFRNTKLELWLTGFINKDKDLGDFRTAAMAAGINNISKRGRTPKEITEVEKYARQIDKVAYDVRIPELVRRYFSDTTIWIKNIYDLLRPNGKAIIDIGDSCFAGKVHVPTDEILNIIATDCGFETLDKIHVRNRRSKNGFPLKQVVLILQKPIKKSSHKYKTKSFIDAALEFENKLPHLEKPHSSRNWGNKLHSLCSYQGKLKPSIAHFLVKYFTKPGQTILDPMSGCGTIPLEAFLQGRKPLGNELQELGYILTKAKVESGQVEDVWSIFNDLVSYVDEKCKFQDIDHYNEFGFNGKIPDYFHPDTYRQILAAREYIQNRKCNTWAEAIVYGCLFHILHGNRPYALSRRSHPVTPFKPAGDFEYRPIASRLSAKINRALSSGNGKTIFSGKTTFGPYERLKYDETVDVVMTSPPFSNSTRFYIANWLRLWFAGWEPEDFKSREKDFLEYKQKTSMDAYIDFFQNVLKWLRKGGRLVMHVGRTKSCNMKDELISRLPDGLNLIHSFDEDVAGREKFGIKDQGATKAHQYLFIEKK